MLISTGGTERVLREAAVPVIPVKDFTGVPEILGGRVKTLHHKIFAGILARAEEEDFQTIVRLGIAPVDLVVVNLYDLAGAAGKPDVAAEEVIEQIDIGGPSLLRAAAKNFQRMFVVADPADYGQVTQLLKMPARLTLKARLDLARKAFAHTRDFDIMVCQTLARVTVEGGRLGFMPSDDPTEV